MRLTQLHEDILYFIFSHINPIDAHALGSTCVSLRKIYLINETYSDKIHIDCFEKLHKYISLGKRYIKINYSNDYFMLYKVLHYSHYYHKKIYITNNNLIDPHKLDILYLNSEKVFYNCLDSQSIKSIYLYNKSNFHHTIRPVK